MKRRPTHPLQADDAEGIHLYDFHLRAARYGSSEVAASSPDVTLASLWLRTGARFIYEYDLNIPWRHEIRIEDQLRPEDRNTYPVCTGGDSACPPEDCGGPESFMVRRNGWYSLDALEDLRPRAFHSGACGKLACRRFAMEAAPCV